ncbi:MAG: hypothetical protein KDA81_02630 [Planctomycetaceae bacterium]|nr:hypothetical protein [Planctomycetaceae bacterium]
MKGLSKLLGRNCLAIVGLTLLSQSVATAQNQTGHFKWRRSNPICPPYQVPNCPIPSCPPVSPHDHGIASPTPDSNVPLSPSATPDDASPDAPTPDSTPAPVPAPVPENNAPQADPFANQPNFAQPQINNALANVGDTGFSGSRAPNMIGDFFGTAAGTHYEPLIVPIGAPSTSDFIYGNLAAAPGANVGRLKLAENVNPIPQDRFFVSYSYFEDVNILGGGADVHRITPGFEKTFMNGNASLEFRFPFADTVSSTYDTANGLRNATEFGNMSVWWKALLIQDCCWTVSAGSGMTLPTADDYVVLDGANGLRVENQAVHWLPFLATTYTPDDRWFMQTMLQFDVDVNGNPVSFGTAFPTSAGRAHDNAYMFVDLSVGYWVYKSRCCHNTIQGIAPVIEFHHNTALDNGDPIPALGLAAPGRTTVSNMVFGLNTKLQDGKSVTMGYVTPIGKDRQFDGELRLFFNWLL